MRLTNKFSSNLMARHLLLTMGEERFGGPATLEKGAAAIAEWGRERGLDLIERMEIDNGSGLSRSTRISALQMAQILSAAYRSRYAPEFLASLPLAGIDGTLRSRMKASPAGAVRLKTGHIDGVSGVAGYVTAGQRQDLRARLVGQSQPRGLRRGRSRARGAGGVDSGQPLACRQLKAAPCPRGLRSRPCAARRRNPDS